MFKRVLPDVPKVEIAPKKTAEELMSQVLNSKDKIWITWESGKVFVGDQVFTKFNPVAIKNYSSSKSKNSWCWEQSLCTIIGESRFDLEQAFPFCKDRAKYYTYKLGIRPTKFLEMYNACMCKAFIPQDLREEVNKLCRVRLGRFDTHLLDKFIHNQNFFRQLKQDNMMHIAPIFLNNRTASNEIISVTMMRKLLGKGLWKQLLKNSFSRNKLIGHNLNRNRYDYFDEDMYCVKDLVEMLQQLPTGMIPSNILHDIPDVEGVELFRKMRIISDRKKQQRISNIITDVKRMSNQLDIKLPKGTSKWNFKTWEEYHEKLNEMVNLKKYSKDKFSWVKGLTQSFDNGKYIAVILDNAFDIKMEGESMKHCVASYGYRVKDEKYLVISIRYKDGSRSSTLGCNVNTNLGVTFNQHYKHCNASVTCKEENEFAKSIIKQLNKEYLDEKVLQQSSLSLETCTDLD